MSDPSAPYTQPSVPAGWYPAPHRNNEMRFWDGRSWHEPSAPADATVIVTPSTPSDSPGSAGSTPKGIAVTALVIGIVAFLTGFVPWVGLVLGLTAVVVGIAALMKRQPKGFAVTGLVLGAVAFVSGIVFTAVAMTFMSAGTGATLSTQSDSAPDKPSSVAEEPATPSPSPEPSQPVTATADGTVEHPFTQPYTAEGLLGGDKYTLTGRVVSADATLQMEEWNMFNGEPPAGYKYVVVELTMTGLDPDGVEPSLAAFDLFLATGEGNRYDPEYAIFGEGMPSMQDGPTLYPGNAFTGYSAYIVPVEVSTFLLYDNGNYVSF